MAKTEFSAFLENEVNKIRWLSYPVKAGFLRRVFIRKAACVRLHPNPNDEFCDPEIGPNYEIMSRYMSDYLRIMSMPVSVTNKEYATKRDALIVERIHPDGYMIMNGHHRWGAACRVGMKRLPVRIVDLTQEDDVRKMLASSDSTRRVTLDLDEVVFRPESDPFLEKPLHFPLNRFFRERLRLGIPALFHMLNKNGYDIWIYSANYYSLDYLRYYFRHYGVQITGIVTGTARKGPPGNDTKALLEARLKTRYRTTVNVNDTSVICAFADSGSFEEYSLEGDGGSWPQEVMKVFEEMRKHE